MTTKRHTHINYHSVAQINYKETRKTINTPFTLDKKIHCRHLSSGGKGYNRHSLPNQMTLQSSLMET